MCRFWSDAMAIATISATALHANIILIRSLVLLIRSNVSSDQTATTHQDNDSLETTIVASRCQLNNNNGTSLSNWAYCVPPRGYEMPNNANRPNGLSLCSTEKNVSTLLHHSVTKVQHLNLTANIASSNITIIIYQEMWPNYEITYFSVHRWRQQIVNHLPAIWKIFSNYKWHNGEWE